MMDKQLLVTKDISQVTFTFPLESGKKEISGIYSYDKANAKLVSISASYKDTTNDKLLGTIVTGSVQPDPNVNRDVPTLNVQLTDTSSATTELTVFSAYVVDLLEAIKTKYSS